MQRCIGDVYNNMNLEVDMFPSDGLIDPNAFREAIKQFVPGSAVTIFTPDDTHFEIALECIKQGLHVLVTKPAVKTLVEHQILYEAAIKYNVLVAIEVHKRWDPMYADARDRIQKLGVRRHSHFHTNTLIPILSLSRTQTIYTLSFSS